MKSFKIDIDLDTAEDLQYIISTRVEKLEQFLEDDKDIDAQLAHTQELERISDFSQMIEDITGAKKEI